MAVVRRLSLVGIADGDLTTASAGPGDTPFDLVTGDLDVETDAAFNGKAVQVAQVGGSAATAEWHFATDLTETGGRMGFIHPGVLGASWPLVGGSHGAGLPGFRIDSSGPGKLRVRDSANAQNGADGTTTMVGGTKYYVQWTQTATAFHLELRDSSFALLETIDRASTYGPSGKIKFWNTLSTPTTPATSKFGELEVRDDPSLPGAWAPWDPEPIFKGAWVGIPRRTSIGVGVVTEATDEVQLIASTNPALTSPLLSPLATPAASGWATATVVGLEPDTTYYLAVELDGNDPGWRGVIHTKELLNSPRSYSVLFGSCQDTGSNHVVFDEMSDVNAAFLAHLGDFGYQDADEQPDPEAAWRAGLESTLNAVRFQGLLDHTPMRYVPDNHDWGGEFSDASSAAGTFFPPAIREISPNRFVDGAGLWSSWVHGRVRFIQLDTRSQRDPYDAANGPTKTMLGSSQKAWLKFLLQHAAEPVIVIFSTIIWTGAGGPDRWASYPDEWNEFVAFVTGLPNVQAKIYVGSGDLHALAAHSGAGDSMAVPRVVGAAFDSGGTSNPEPWDQGIHPNDAGRGQFGVLEIEDIGGDEIVITFEGRQDDGQVLVDMVTPFPIQSTPLVSRWAGKGLVDGSSIAAGTAGPGDTPITAVNGTTPTIAEWDDRGTWIEFPADVASYVVMATYDDPMPTQTWSFHVRVPTSGASRILTAWDGTRGAVAYVLDMDASGIVSISTGTGVFLDLAPVALAFGSIYRLDVVLDHGDLAVLVYEESGGTPIGFAAALLPQDYTPNELWVGPTFAFTHPVLQVGQFRRTNAAMAIPPLGTGGSGSPGGRWVGRPGVPFGSPLSEVVGWSK
jgi:hypothetical protein